MNLLTKVKVYLFNTKNNFDINITPSDTVKSVKTQIIKILTDKKYDLKYTSENAFDIRLIEEDDTKPNMDYPALENNSLIFMVKPKTIAFLENPKYDPSQDYSSEKILGNVKAKKKSKFLYCNISWLKNIFNIPFRLSSEDNEIIFEEFIPFAL